MIDRKDQNKIVAGAAFQSNVLAVRMRINKLVVSLSSKVYILDLYTFQILSILPTRQFPQQQPYNLLSLSNDHSNFILACPSLQLGQILIIHLDEQKQRKIKAHQSNLSNIAVTLSGDKVATVSQKGMNIRVFNTSDGSTLQEVRRGNQYGEIYSLYFSRGGNWLTVTSDSPTIHVFSSPPSPSAQEGRYLSTVESPPPNPKSKLYFLRKFFPYYDAEYSYCQYNIPDFQPQMRYLACFGFHDDNLLVINDYGKFRRINVNAQKGGICCEVVEEGQLLQINRQGKK